MTPELIPPYKRRLQQIVEDAMEYKEHWEIVRDVFRYMDHMYLDRLEEAAALALVAPWTADQLMALYRSVDAHLWYMHRHHTRTPHRTQDHGKSTNADWRYVLLINTALKREQGTPLMNPFCPQCYLPEALR